MSSIGKSLILELSIVGISMWALVSSLITDWAKEVHHSRQATGAGGGGGGAGTWAGRESRAGTINDANSSHPNLQYFQSQLLGRGDTENSVDGLDGLLVGQPHPSVVKLSSEMAQCLVDMRDATTDILASAREASSGNRQLGAAADTKPVLALAAADTSSNIQFVQTAEHLQACLDRLESMSHDLVAHSSFDTSFAR